LETFFFCGFPSIYFTSFFYFCQVFFLFFKTSNFMNQFLKYTALLHLNSPLLCCLFAPHRGAEDKVPAIRFAKRRSHPLRRLRCLGKASLPRRSLPHRGAEDSVQAEQSALFRRSLTAHRILQSKKDFVLCTAVRSRSQCLGKATCAA
jgi:hypothetical protein